MRHAVRVEDAAGPLAGEQHVDDAAHEADMARAGEQLALEGGIERVGEADQGQEGDEERQAVTARAVVRVLSCGQDQSRQQDERRLLGENAEREARAAGGERPETALRRQGENERGERPGYGRVVQKHAAVEVEPERAEREEDHRRDRERAVNPDPAGEGCRPERS